MTNFANMRNLTILLGSTTTVLAATIISPALPEMTQVFQDVPNADFLVRLTLTMPALFIAIGAPIAGILLDRLGRKPVLIAALILYGLTGTAGFVLDSLTAILVSRALLGLAVAGIMSGFTTLILDYFSGSKLNQFMGYQGAFIGLGGMVFLLAAGYLADVGWRFPFLVHLFAFVVLPGVLFAIQEPQRQTDSSQQEGSVEVVTFPVKAILPIYFTVFVGMVIFFIFPVQVPFYLTAESGVSNSQVGIALSLQTFTSVLIALQFQRLKARFSFMAILSLIFLVFSINHTILSLTANYGLVIVALLIGGLGIGLFPPNNSVWLASVTPPALRGRAVGGMTSALFLGQFFSPIFTQPLIGRIGLAGTFGVAGIISLTLAAIYFMMTVRHSENASNGGSELGIESA
ncbi:MFS transporter [Chloroflexi bacterium TSY]|nr:MFS transporter [Chloroflexi bacterium TSY]